MKQRKMKKFFKGIRQIDWKSCVMGIILSIMILLAFNFLILPELNKSPFRRLQDAIDSCPYITAEYQANVFDCSNMAQMLDDWLEEKYGYESWMVEWRKMNPLESGHVMLLVNGQLVEPTRKSILGTLLHLAEEEDWSNQVTIFDEATQLPYYIESEWSYPKKW